MGSSIFAEESGDESARERRANDRRRSVFRRRDDDGGAGAADDEAMGPSDGDERSADGDESEDGTMTVFSGDEVFEVVVDDE